MVYQEHAMKKLSVSKRLRRSKKEQEDAHDEAKRGQPKIKKTDANV